VPIACLAQQKQGFWRLGVVFGGARTTVKHLEEALLAGLKERGYDVGRNLVVDVRYSDGDTSRYPLLVDEVVTLGPDVLIGANTGVAIIMKSRTSTIPIVTATTSDVVGAGLAHSLARPAGNVTGTSLQLHEVGGKHVEIMAELVPRMRRVAVLSDLKVDKATEIGNEQYESLVRAAASAKGISVAVHRVDADEDMHKVFRLLESERADALFISLSPRFNRLRREISQLAAGIRLPSITSVEEYALSGGLMSYGPSFVDSFHRAAYFVDRILKGARPADLPIEQPTRFSLVLNAKVAKALGIKIAGSVLLRADRLIE
jgi:putative ABC transport system substrate-binding protein